MATQCLDFAAAEPIFVALGDTTRRHIMRLVSEGPKSVSELARALTVTLTAITQHLHVLQGCGLVQTKKIGRVRVCAMDYRGLDVLQQWTTLNRQLWDARFQALAAMMDEPD